MKSILITTVITVLLALTGRDQLTGRWESKPSVKGNITRVIFKPDSTFEGFINKKPFVTGTYTFKDNILHFVDNGCNGAKAIYKINFFSDSDSLRFEAISDTCTQRREGMTRLVLGRVQK